MKGRQQYATLQQLLWQIEQIGISYVSSRFCTMPKVLSDGGSIPSAHQQLPKNPISNLYTYTLTEHYINWCVMVC
jgi:hypothetical protein